MSLSKVCYQKPSNSVCVCVCVCVCVTCLYGAGAGTAGLSRAAGCGCRDEADVVEPAAWNLNLLHVGLGGQWDDGLELGGTDSSNSHRLDWF